MRNTTAALRPRRLWLTVPLYAVLLAVMVADVWAASFWLAVGGSLGLTLAGAAVVVVVVLAVLLLTDLRRQRRLHRLAAVQPAD
ncbi:hypothetical protein [Geodermatophilus sp. SYSU D00710]